MGHFQVDEGCACWESGRGDGGPVERGRLCQSQKKLCWCRCCRLGANADSRVALPGKSLESTRAEEGIPGFHERASVEGAKHDLCLQLACPNLTVSCPGCRRPRALDAGCSQSPQQVRLSGNVARIPGKLGHLPRCLPVACAWRPAAWDGVSGSHPVLKMPSPMSITARPFAVVHPRPSQHVTKA